MSNRKVTWEYAVDHYGYVTTRAAAELGVPPVELAKMAARGGITNIAYGIYRVDAVPMTPRDQFYEAVLRAGKDAFLSHDAVLSLHELALVNPRQIRVGTPHRVEAAIPDWMLILRRRVPPEDLTVYDGIPCTTVARALLDCQEIVMHDRLTEAAEQARQRGLLLRAEHREVTAALGVAT